MGLAERIAEAAQQAAAPEGTQGAQVEGMGPGDGYLDEDVEILPEGAPDSSEGGGAGGPDGEATEEPEARSDDRAPPPPTVSRLVRNISIKERELAQERQERRQEQAEIRRLTGELEAARGGDPIGFDDPVDLVRAWAMRRLGTKDASDPRVMQALQDATQDLTVEGFPQSSDLVPDLRARREQRQRERQDRERFRSYDERLRQLDREREQAKAEAQMTGLRSAATQYLSVNSERTPLLQAAGEAEGFDPADLVVRRALQGVRTGEFPDPATTADLARLYGVIAAGYEDHYRGLVGKLSARAGKPPARLDAQVKRSVQGAPPSRAAGADAGKTQQQKARSTRGGGGRGNAGLVDEPDQDERLDLAARIARAERAARRR